MYICNKGRECAEGSLEGLGQNSALCSGLLNSSSGKILKGKKGTGTYSVSSVCQKTHQLSLIFIATLPGLKFQKTIT